MAWRKRSALQKTWHFVLRRLGLVLMAGFAPISIPAAGQTTTYIGSADAPIAWREFALVVKERLQAWLAQEDDPVRRFRASLEERGTMAFVARVWVLANGEIARVEFDGAGPSGAVELEPFLVRKSVGVAPPADLLQPLHLALSIQGKS